MSTSSESLPDRVMERLWAAMRGNYGARWDRMFPVPPVPPGADPGKHAYDSVKAVQSIWAEKLGRFSANLQAIAFGLEHLPADPPNLPEFVALCNRRPDPKPPALPAPEPDKAKVAEALAMARSAFARKGDHLDTLRELAESDARDGTFRGRKVTLAQRQTYRQALGMDRGQA